MEKEIQVNETLSIVELEERFETTVAALDADRCTIKTGDISVA